MDEICKRLDFQCDLFLDVESRDFTWNVRENELQEIKQCISVYYVPIQIFLLPRYFCYRDQKKEKLVFSRNSATPRLRLVLQLSRYNTRHTVAHGQEWPCFWNNGVSLSPNLDISDKASGPFKGRLSLPRVRGPAHLLIGVKICSKSPCVYMGGAAEMNGYTNNRSHERSLAQPLIRYPTIGQC